MGISKGLSLTLEFSAYIYIVDMLPWLRKMEIWGFENLFLEMNGQSVVDLNTKNGM